MINRYIFQQIFNELIPEHKVEYMRFEDLYVNNIPSDSYDYIIMYHEMEVSNDVVFEDIHKYLKENNLPENKFILVMGDCSITESYKLFVKRNYIKKEINTLSGFFMEICVRNSFEPKYKNKVLKHISENVDKIKKKRFLSMNGRLKPHRHALIEFIGRNNLGEYIDYSLLQNNLPLDKYNFEIDVEKYVKNIDEGEDRIGWHEMKVDEDKDFHVNYVYADSKWWYAHKENLLPLYSNYNMDIVTESESNHEDKLFFTEKTLRPIYFGLPFFMIGNKGMLSRLKEFGYATYDDIIDESYDTLPTWRKRLKYATKEIRRFCQMSDSDFSNEIKKTKNNILHNVDHFFNNDFQIKRIQKQIEDIIR